MTRTVVGVLRGGNSSEYDLSLKTGTSVMHALPESEYDTRDILVDKKGRWYVRGLSTEPLSAVRQMDVVVNAMHGGIGEDGTVARLLEKMHVPYTGSHSSASARALNKAHTRDLFTDVGINMPRGRTFYVDDDLDTGEMARVIFAEFPPPYVVKPTKEGSSLGIVVARTVYDLPDALGDVLDAFGSAVVEELVRGTEYSVGVIEDYRGALRYTLPPAEVQHASRAPYTSRIAFGWGEDTSHMAPSLSLVQEQKDILSTVAQTAHDVLQLRQYSRSDFIVAPHGVYLLETSALPALNDGAPFVVALESVGSSLKEFLEHAMRQAITQSRSRT